MQRRLWLWTGAILALCTSSRDLGVGAREVNSALASGSGAGPERAPPASSRAVHTQQLDGLEPPVFAVLAPSKGAGRLVFLHGMCGHGLGYAQAFQHAAASKGSLVAPQADVVCGKGPWAKWSRDTAALDQRIEEAFRKLGDEGPLNDVCVMGVSQGATRAAWLVRDFPDRYRRLVSIGAPTIVGVAGLERLRAAVFMVGERERKDLMLGSEQALRKVGVPARSVVIPGAEHASLGATPEQTMADVLDWLWQVSPLPSSRPSAR